MSSKGKYIGVESRVQYEILEAAIQDYLSGGTLDKEKCFSHIKQFTKGNNRAGKILKHISVLITKNEFILSRLCRHIDGASFTQLSTGDRNAMLLCLFCNSFPITYDILIGFAQAFKVQPIVSKEVIIHKIGSVYGSNRSMHIAVTEIIPLLIEFGCLKRIKTGLYTSGQSLSVKFGLILELIVFTDIKLSPSKSIRRDEIVYKPWYSYFDSTEFFEVSFRYFIKEKTSGMGSGYFSI